MNEFGSCFDVDRAQDARTLHTVREDRFDEWKNGLSPRHRAAVDAAAFDGKPGSLVILPGQEADGWTVAIGVEGRPELSAWALAGAAQKLAPGTYRLEDGDPGEAALGWALGQYRFDRYMSDRPAPEPRVLLHPEDGTVEPVLRQADAQALVRDLVNTPAEDMGPAELEAAVRTEAEAHGAAVTVVTGDALLTQNFPTIHAVGRAASAERAPRLIELNWGEENAPVLTLVGKGVCFDTGGLDVKGAAGMRLMKKDMGGAAHALALARLVMQAKLPVRLRLLIPAVENSVSGNALRPGDVVKTRSGLSVEVHNTDAEGRLVLCDALAYACERDTDLIVDFATLTGAARVALGPDLPALFTDDEEVAGQIDREGHACDDPVWRLPLWQPYQRLLHSDIADMANAGTSSFAGAIVAALYLSRFVLDGRSWVHFDTFAWMPTSRPGRPKGGEALGLRATFRMLVDRYGTVRT